MILYIDLKMMEVIDVETRVLRTRRVNTYRRLRLLVENYYLTIYGTAYQRPVACHEAPQKYT